MRKAWVGVALAVVMLATAGCSGRDGAAGERGTAVPSTEASGAVGSRPFEAVDVTPTVLPMVEWRLPEGCVLDDCGARFAVASQHGTDARGDGVRLLDMDTGEHRLVVPSAVSGAGYQILGTACSDGWVVWEEVLGDEQSAPLDVSWRVYAASIDAAATAIGPSFEVTAAVTAVRSRPMLQVDGDILYAMTNTFPNPRQEGATHVARITATDLAIRSSREVYRGDHMLGSYVVQGDGVLLYESVDNQSQEMRFRVVTLNGSAELASVDLENEYEIAHYPVYRDGTLVWGVRTDPLVARPRLHLTDADGTVWVLAEAGGDAQSVGGWLVYETFSPGGPRISEWPAIVCLDQARRERFVVVQTSGVLAEVAWRLVPGKPAGGDTFVITGELEGAVVGAELGGCWVRRYTVP